MPRKAHAASYHNGHYLTRTRIKTVREDLKSTIDDLKKTDKELGTLTRLLPKKRHSRST